MARIKLPKSFTIRLDQVQFLNERFENPRYQSEWVREAIDLKIEQEKEDEKRGAKKRKQKQYISGIRALAHRRRARINDA